MIQRLSYLRHLWGWSQAFVAVMLHVSPSTISRWERGKASPAESNQEKIDALLRAIEEAVPGQESEPKIEIREGVGGDVVARDQTIGRDRVDGNVITTSQGSVLVVQGETVHIYYSDPDTQSPTVIT